MKNKHCVLFLCILFLSFNASAQLGGLLNRVRNKSEKKTNNSENTNSTPTSSAKPKSDDNANKPSGKPRLLKMAEPKITDPFILQHLGQIIFSKKPINAEVSYASQKYTNSFSVLDKIYCQAFLPHLLFNNTLYKNGDSNSNDIKNNEEEQYEYVMYVDGVRVKDPVFKGGRQDYCERLDFFEQNYDTTYTEPLAWWITAASNLSVGVHKVKIELWGINDNGYTTAGPICSGEIAITKQKGDVLRSSKDQLHDIAYKKHMEELHSELMPDEGMTSETHKKYIGQIVFSSQHIKQGAENQAAFRGQFNATDLIYGRCYFSKSLHNTYTYVNNDSNSVALANGDHVVVLIVDHKDSVFYSHAANDNCEDVFNGDMDDYQSKATTFELTLNPSRAEVNKYGYSHSRYWQWPELVNKLSPGEHNVRVELWAGATSATSTYFPKRRSLTALSIGEFKLSKKPGDHIKIGIDFNTIKPGMVNAALEKEMFNALASSDGDKLTPSKVVIVDAGWTIVRNELTGIILGRKIGAIVKVKYKDSGFCYAEYVEYNEDYTGSSYTHINRTNDVGGSQIDCDSAH